MSLYWAHQPLRRPSLASVINAVRSRSSDTPYNASSASISSLLTPWRPFS